MKRMLAAAVSLVAALSGCGGGANEPQVTSAMRPSMVTLGDGTDFSDWVRHFRPRALAQGITPATFDRAFAGVRYDPDVIRRDRHQAEFARPIWEYLDGAVSTTRVETGRGLLSQHRQVLDAIEARYGVDREVVVAIWGMESSYGSYRGSTPVIPSLATLAYDGRRSQFFEEQLVAALKIVQAGDTAPANMTGSWAGAMGHTQFMPTSYLRHAVDFRGDGRRDIWSDDPTDALASTAAYLAENGWSRGQPWAIEVILPPGFDMSRSGKGTRIDTSDWRGLGLRAANGRPLPTSAMASVLLPAGANGPALLIFDNFNVIASYNASDSYVIGVGHLSDRLSGGGGFAGAWPRGDRPLTLAERTELQERLTRAGYDTGGADGKLGTNTSAALRQWQIASGMPADGYPSAQVLERLR